MGYQLAWNWEKAPEEWELEKKRNKLNRLKLILSQRELRLQLISKDLEIFIGKYLRIVGVRLAKLDKIEAEIADILAANQPENLDAQYRAEKAWERASESKKEVDSKKKNFHREEKPIQELKDLYREVAKQVHPDLAITEDERRKREELMKMANEAFQKGDVDGLHSILTEWKSSPEQIRGEGIAAELVRVIRQIDAVEKRIKEIENQIAMKKNSDYYKLMKEVEISKSSGIDLLSKMASALDEKIDRRLKYKKELLHQYHTQKI